MRKLSAFLVLGVLLLVSSCRFIILKGSNSSEVFNSSENSFGKSVLSAAAREDILSKIQSGAVTSASEKIEGQKEEKPPETIESTPNITAQPAIITNHQSIPKTSYYGYSLLNENEKSLYNTLTAAIEKTQNFIDVSSFNVSVDDYYKTYLYLVADNPDYFWLSKKSVYGYNSSGKVVIAGLKYYDGEIIDGFLPGRYELDPANTASRSKISAQIAEFNAKISELISGIPSDKAALYKERLAHNLTVGRIQYDTVAVNSVGDPDFYSHTFTVYGGAVNRIGVCEAYSELFQLVCYQIGINCITVRGTSQNVGHMWNSVFIDGKWCNVDTTWDDVMSLPDVFYYEYFNVTDAKLSADHSADAKENYPLPSCNSPEMAFFEIFGLKVPSAGEMPQDITRCLAAAKEYSEQSVYFIFPSEINNAAALVYLKRFRSDFEYSHLSPAGGYFPDTGYLTISNVLIVRVAWR